MLYPVIVRPPPRINDGAAISDLFALLLAIVVIVGAALGEPLIAAVGALVFVVTIAARLWARLSLEEVSYGRELSADHLFQGDEIKLSLALENNKPLPVPWVRVRDFLPLGLQDASDTIVERPFLGGSEITEITSLGRYERVRINFRVRAANRGFYRLGPAKLESGDLFGMFGSTREEPQSSQTITVYPKVVPVPWLNLPAARPIGDSRTPTGLLDDPSRPSGIREYRPGDPLRSVDWKATARHTSEEKLFVRTFDPSVSHYAVVLLEAATTDKPWEGYHANVLERAVTCAASVAVRASDAGHRVGLIANGVPPHNEGSAVIPPATSPGHLLDIMKSLAMVKPMAIKSLDELARNHGQGAMPPGATIIYVAGAFRPGAVEYVSGLSRRGYRVQSLYVGDDDPPQIPDLNVMSVGAYFAEEMDESSPAGADPHSQFRRPTGRSDG